MSERIIPIDFRLFEGVEKSFLCPLGSRVGGGVHYTGMLRGSHISYIWVWCLQTCGCVHLCARSGCARVGGGAVSGGRGECEGVWEVTMRGGMLCSAPGLYRRPGQCLL